ncbi:hypothetical protein BO70DRAFT_71103 [Aspergillus heteromorphus CBS 117.55]|uniref:Uncharacterized protein n=1 Tax=Aspergillus heteromorphus CBS 117.55 TaxID=1448321 RepID=A0A317VVQ0_9EURO|nr:uncharacterized protein BO70DRAFT_71103 [Aspergillus heteromorphus CBS 117.55]PWY77042.1 hypothetical protein BO70DRAFT_71103 [Aspergillus heteromorphus CBS 117.55]
MFLGGSYLLPLALLTSTGDYSILLFPAVLVNGWSVRVSDLQAGIILALSFCIWLLSLLFTRWHIFLDASVYHIQIRWIQTSGGRHQRSHSMVSTSYDQSNIISRHQRFVVFMLDKTNPESRPLLGFQLTYIISQVTCALRGMHRSSLPKPTT